MSGAKSIFTRVKKFFKSRRNSPTLLVVLIILFSLLSAWLLRLNNLGMVSRRDALVTADKTNDVEKVQQAARELQNYVAHHMNTMMGRVALQTLYNQAAQTAIEAAKPSEISSSVYQAATEACKSSLTNYGYRAWANCVANRVGASGVASLDTTVNEPDPDVYYVEYSSARWSLDLAGIVLLASVILAIVLIVRLAFLLLNRVVSKLKKRHKKAVLKG